MSQVNSDLIKYLASIITDDPNEILESAAPAPAPAKPKAPQRPKPGKSKPWQVPKKSPKELPGPKAGTETKPAPTKPKAPTRPTPKPQKPWQVPKKSPKDLPGPKAAAGTKPAPAKPKAPARPTPKPSKPWQVPKKSPKELPGPKAQLESNRRRVALNEAWNPDVNKNVRDFWGNLRRGEHLFSKHPIMAMYGDELAQAQYHDDESAYKQSSATVQRAFQNIMRIESRHRAKLEQLAVKLVANHLQWPEEIFDAYLNRKPSLPQLRENKEPSNPQQPDEELKMTPQMEKELHKRVTMNLLTQGHALHAMDTLHYKMEKEINEIDPQLLQLYSTFSKGSRGMYYFTDIIRQLNSSPQMRQMGQVGFTRIVDADDVPDKDERSLAEGSEISEADLPDFEDEGPAEEEQEYRNLKVVGYGIIFPVLVQELVKGAQELISLHGSTHLSDKEAKAIYGLADDPAEEPWYFLVGPQIWKYLLKVVPRDHDLMSVMQKIAQQDPDNLHKLLSGVIETIHSKGSLDELKQEIVDLMREIEEEYGDDTFEQDDYEDFGGEDWSPDEEEDEEDFFA